MDIDKNIEKMEILGLDKQAREMRKMKEKLIKRGYYLGPTEEKAATGVKKGPINKNEVIDEILKISTSENKVDINTDTSDVERLKKMKKSELTNLHKVLTMSVENSLYSTISGMILKGISIPFEKILKFNAGTLEKTFLEDKKIIDILNKNMAKLMPKMGDLVVFSSCLSTDLIKTASEHPEL